MLKTYKLLSNQKNIGRFGFSGPDLPKTLEKSEIWDKQFFGQNRKSNIRLVFVVLSIFDWSLILNYPYVIDALDRQESESEKIFAIEAF